MAISMLKIRRPLGRLIFNMGIAIPGKTVFLIETAPRYITLKRRTLYLVRSHYNTMVILWFCGCSLACSCYLTTKATRCILDPISMHEYQCPLLLTDSSYTNDVIMVWIGICTHTHIYIYKMVG